MEQLNLFEMLYDNYKLDANKELNIISLFSGYGSQELALKYLGVKYKHHRCVEWALPSIIAYASLHRNELENYGIDIAKDFAREQIAERLYKLGVSLDYQKPATLDQLKRLDEKRLRLCFNSIFWANNLVDVCRVSGNALGIERERVFANL